MPINMSCPSCGKTLAAPDSAAGKRAKCPSCGQIMIVPAAAQPAEGFGAPSSPQPSFSPPPAADSGNDWLEQMGNPTPVPKFGDTEAGATGAGGEARRPCPECGEMIVAGAAKCRFCNAIFDPRLRVKVKRAQGAGDDELQTIDWVLCLIPGCILLGCILGIVYAIQGKPKGIKMVVISFAAGVVWNILGVVLQMSLHPHGMR